MTENTGNPKPGAPRKKKPAQPGTARKKTATKKAAGGTTRSPKKSPAKAPPVKKKTGALEVFSYAAGKTVSRLSGLANRATKAIRGATEKVLHPGKKTGK